MGQLKNDYTLGATNFSESTSDHRITCPAGKQWTIIHILVNRSDAATLNVRIRNASDQLTGYIDNVASGTGTTVMGSTQASTVTAQMPVILTAGQYIWFNFGAAQGATASCSLWYIEEAL